MLAAEPDWVHGLRCAYRPSGQRYAIRSADLNGAVDMGNRISGSGKSAVSRALRAQGHATHDADEDGIRT